MILMLAFPYQLRVFIRWGQSYPPIAIIYGNSLMVGHLIQWDAGHLKEHSVSLYLPLRMCWYFNAGISVEAILLERDEEADQKLIIGVPWSIQVY